MTQVKIYSPEGKEAEVDARNAAEMVQHNGWRYEILADPEAAKIAELEAIETILKGTLRVYKEDGKVFNLSRANARELLSVGGYSLKSYTSEDSTAEEDAAEEDAVEEDAVEEDAVEEDAVVEVEEDDAVADVLNDTLASIAQAAGFDTMDDYLDSLNESPLRDLALLRYEEKIHHRASKANTIVKIIELEEAALEASKF